MSKLDTLGIIAGNGIYPATLAQAARMAGVAKIVAAAFEQETDPALAKYVDAIEWLRVGQLGRLIKFFRAHGVRQAIMAGQIAPKNLFDLRPDLRAVVLLGKLRIRNAETIFGAIADELASEGISLLPATTFLEDLLPAPGLVCGPRPGKKQMPDIEFAFRMAKEICRLDIGQAVVVKKGTVLAVEAFEGTDECIRRGGALGKGGATVAKVSKPNQDLRFDVPVIGPRTVQSAADAGIPLVVVEAGRTLLLGKEEIVRSCEHFGITLFAAG
ncbi:MAG: LpxI family protein [Verrucomicrobiales bacterium]